MSEKTSPAGWVVQVSVPQPAPQRQIAGEWTEPDVAVPLRYFEVAIADAEEAVEIVRKRTSEAASHDVEVRAIRALSPAEISALKLKAGAVKPA